MVKHSYLFNESSTDFTKIQSPNDFSRFINNHTLIFASQNCRFEFTYEFNGEIYNYSLDFEGGKFAQAFNKITKFVAQKVLKELTTTKDEQIRKYVRQRTNEISDLIFGGKNLIEAIVIILAMQKLDKVELNQIAFLIEPTYENEVLIGFAPSKQMAKVLNAQKTENDLSKLTVKELREIAKGKSIDLPLNVKKSELVNLLQD